MKNKQPCAHNSFEKRWLFSFILSFSFLKVKPQRGLGRRREETLERIFIVPEILLHEYGFSVSNFKPSMIHKQNNVEVE